MSRTPLTFDFERVPGSLRRVGRFSLPNWEVIADWIEAHVAEEERDEVWADAEWSSLHRMEEEFAPDGHWVDSDKVCVLTRRTEPDAREWIRHAEVVWDRVRKLHHVARKDVWAASVALFEDRGRFEEYVAAVFGSDFRDADALTTSPPAPLIVIAPDGDDSDVWRTLSGELSNWFALFRDWPSWLGHGIYITALELPHARALTLSDFGDEALVRMRMLWTPESIQEFWSGPAFSGSEERRSASWQLARYLISAVLLKPAAAVRGFLDAAGHDDAGSAAARTHFGATLSDLVSGLLGPGDWEPRPDTWPDS